MVGTPTGQTNTGGITTTTTTNVPPAPRLKTLSQWAKIGLDLGSAAFSKLQAKESSYEDSKTKYNLEPEGFENYKQNLIEKVNRMHAVPTFTIDDSTGTQCNLLTEYTKLVPDDLSYAKELRWPGKGQLPNTLITQEDYDKHTDEQIKSSTIGSYINESLTEEAKKQLRADIDFFQGEDNEGNVYFDGPSYFFKIADYVDPDNGHLIENVRMELRNLHVKDFGFSVIKMMAEFKRLRQRVNELGGTYDTDDQYLDFWASLKTMQEKEFSRYVKQEKDAFRKLKKGSRPKIEEYIRDITQKEVAMRTDKEWNVMSAEDAMVMALVNALDSTTKSKDSPLKSNTDKEKKKRVRGDSRIPEWKKKAPEKGEPKEKVVDGKTYYWCTECRNGKGMWALHKVHDSNYRKRAAPDDTPPTNESKGSAKPSPNKKVAFSTDTKQEDGPKIQVKKDLIDNARAYLAQYDNSDFSNGGMQG